MREHSDSVWSRFFTFVMFSNERRIVSAWRRFYGEENVDSTVFYDNIKNAYIDKMRSTKCDFGFRYNDSFITEMRMIDGDMSELSVFGFAKFLYKKNKSKLVFYLREFCIGYVKSFGSRYLPEMEEGCSVNNGVKEPLIYVRFPKVRVTLNEDDSVYHDMEDYFISMSSVFGILGHIDFSTRGNQMGFSGCKTTFTSAAYNGGYVHSHRPMFTRGECVMFKSHCTGSNSPINRLASRIASAMTTANATELDYAYILQMADCISKFVTVESSQGVPHIRMLSVFSSSSNVELRYSITSLLYSQSVNQRLFDIGKATFDLNKDAKLIKFSFIDGVVSISNSSLDTILLLSNLAYEIDKNESIYVDAVINNGKYYKAGNISVARPSDSDKQSYVCLCGKKYMFKISDNDKEQNTNTLKIIRPEHLVSFLEGFLQKAQVYISNKSY